MATVVLSAAGAAIGGSIGGTALGLSSVAIGRAVGATLGKVVDQRVMGQGSDVVEHGKVDRFRLTNVGEGAAISQLYGRMRMGAQVIWASDFQETVNVSGGGGGKGGQSRQSRPEVREYSYSVSLALAVCEGEITRIGRVWADGDEISPNDLNMRVYPGSQDQLPDPLMEAIEGPGLVPAYRGTAYVVIENLGLKAFGNRVPQFSFEVVRPEQPDQVDAEEEMTRAIRAVALMPGTGEYALATTPVHYVDGNRGRWSANINTPAGRTDFAESLDSLNDELPNCEAASLIVSWFGNDLRCGECRIQPKVERRDVEGENMKWTVSSARRNSIPEISRVDGRPIYGGTPSDASVVESIQALNASGQKVMFYPFVLMDQLNGNTLPNPYDPAASQPHLPWRGRITLSKAPGVAGSPDGTQSAQAEVDAFFGTIKPHHYGPAPHYQYLGPKDEWSLSRFIMHYAALCAYAGGVESFCIGSEFRGLTQIRGAGNTFIVVQKLRELAADVRAMVGPDTKISYAADWSEYFGYQPQDGSGDRYFHLDLLWSDPNIDFIGIDNYMPLSDWRDGTDHLDGRDWNSIYDLDYLRANIAGAEGYDWFYHSAEAEAAQIRTPITDDEYDEPWVWRYKDIRNWWSNPHHERVGGARAATPTGWVPGSKPIWFTEFGCAAIDKGTNQPNKFLDQKSSESSLPKFSNGARDDLIQKQYLRAVHTYWADEANNPVSDLYGGAMIDMTRAFVWAWDTRPYPFFPNALSVWSDGENYPRGHWINGRTSTRSLASVVGEICDRSGLTAYDTSGLYGTVRGYVIDDVSDARSALQPLMLRYAFDAVERDGVLRFVMRTGQGAVVLQSDRLALSEDLDGRLEQSRESEADLAGRVRLRFVQTDGNFDVLSEEAILADDATHSVSASDLPMALTRPEGRQIAERWLSESRISRESVRMALPPSLIGIGAGDVIEVAADQSEGSARYRVDRVELGNMQLIEAVRVDPEVYVPSALSDDLARVREFIPPVPLTSVFMDLPLLTGGEVAHAPYLAVTGTPWPGSVAVYQSPSDSGFFLNSVIAARSSIGFTKSPLSGAPSGLIDRGIPLEVDMLHGTLGSISDAALLGGANLVAIGDGSPNGWELFQFRDAELIAPGRYLLSHRLRRQLGSDAVARDIWPVGSWIVPLNGIPLQIDLARNLRRIAQTFRIGPAQRGYDDPSYEEMVHAFDGNGLRPYTPVHLRAVQNDGDLAVTWVRRTRIDGDDWELPDVPLAEESESYTVRILQSGGVVRTQVLSRPKWTYSAAMRQTDGVAGTYQIAVAQNSARYGIGPFKTIEQVA